MILEIEQIKQWFRENVGAIVPDGDYFVPINGKEAKVTIKEGRIFID